MYALLTWWRTWSATNSAFWRGTSAHRRPQRAQDIEARLAHLILV
jgi:hypothetical protein